MDDRVIYDLLVVGNGLAAQTLLYELIRALELKDMNCQNFTVAQIFSEQLAPACSIRSTSTISLNGIEEGISDLGDSLRKGFFAFEAFQKEHSLSFVEPVKQFITATDKLKLESLQRRYKTLTSINHSNLKTSFDGVELNSYLVCPEMLQDWFNNQIQKSNMHRIEDFLLKTSINSEGIIESLTHNGATIKSKKIVFCTGAYAAIFSRFFPEDLIKVNQQVVAGSYLQKNIKLPESFILTVDGYNLLYRKSDEMMVLGSASTKGAICSNEFSELKNIFNKMKDICSIDLGEFEDFKVLTGLRHKASKRIPVCGFADESKRIGLINGLYKNGYSLPFHFSKIMVKELLSP
jgi:hypothetical protein